MKDVKIVNKNGKGDFVDVFINNKKERNITKLKFKAEVGKINSLLLYTYNHNVMIETKAIVNIIDESDDVLECKKCGTRIAIKKNKVVDIKSPLIKCPLCDNIIANLKDGLRKEGSL